MGESRASREPEVLRAVRPALQRGRHLALLAATGAGHELVFGEAAASLASEAEGLCSLVLVPSREAGLRVGAAMATAPSAAGLGIRVWPPSEGGGAAEVAEVLIGRPIPLLREIRGGRLPTGGVKLVCVDAADVLLELGEWPAVEALLDTVGAEARRIIASGRFDGELAELLVHQLSRARRWPEELFAEDAAPEGAGAAEGELEVLWYGAATREEERLDLLAAALAGGKDEAAAEPVLVICPDSASSDRVRSGLRVRGIRVTDEPGGGVLVVTDEPGGGVLVVTEAAPEGPTEMQGPWATAVRWGAPDDLTAYTERLPVAGRRLAMVDALHLTQLELTARRAGWATRPVVARPPEEDDSVGRFRERVRERLRTGDLSGELLLLDPLLEETPAATVAAALAALLRERPGLEEEAGAPHAEGRPQAPPREAVLPAWTRIFLNVGKRDGAGPGDIVGAITGETGAAGGQIGRIDLRSSYTLVDIDAEIADRVIRQLGGAQIKGRTVAVRRAREAG